jgi:hypothetical protein
MGGSSRQGMTPAQQEDRPKPHEGPAPGYVPGESAAGEEDPGASLDTPPDEPESVPPVPDADASTGHGAGALRR